MLPRRSRHGLALLLLVLGWPMTVAGETYSLCGDSGGQLQLGAGVPLPIQPVDPAATGTVFPKLRIPPAPGATVMGTTVMTMHQKLSVPASVLSRLAAQQTLGVFSHHPFYYAVGTNLSFRWPVAPATLSTAARTGAKTTTFTTGSGGFIRYSNAGATKFGGPARFVLSGGPPSGLMPAVPMTYYAIAVQGAGNPPCTHTALTPVPFPGPGNPACIAVLGQGLPSLAAVGGPAGTLVTTPGGSPAAVGAGGPVPGIGIGKFGPLPAGTVSFFTFTPAMTMPGYTDMATSWGYPLTTGRISVSAPGALGGGLFTLTGHDSRTIGGAGTLQLVAGALSQRSLTGPSANRGWIRLGLKKTSTPGFSQRFAIVGTSTGLAWSWRIAMADVTVASATGVGPIGSGGAPALFATAFITSINANLGTSGCVAQAVSGKPDEFDLTCPCDFDFFVGDATASSECKATGTLTPGVCSFNPSIVQVVTPVVPALRPWGLLALSGLLAAMPVLLAWRRRLRGGVAGR